MVETETEESEGKGSIEIPEHKFYEISDIFTRMDEQLDALIRLQIDNNNLLRELLGKVLITPPEPEPGVNKTTYKGTTIHRKDGEWTVTYKGDTFTGTWDEVLTWIDEHVVIETTEELLTDIYEILQTEGKPIDIFSLALTIPANTAEGSATSVTESTTIPYDSIAYIVVHFPDAARLKARIFITANGNQILPIKKRNDGVNYVSLRNSTMLFPVNYEVNGIMELKMYGWNTDTEDSHQVFALIGARQKI